VGAMMANQIKFVQIVPSPRKGEYDFQLFALDELGRIWGFAKQPTRSGLYETAEWQQLPQLPIEK
jgi:hypothetical protein